MFIPLRTDSPTKYFPVANIAIVVVCSIVFLYQTTTMDAGELGRFFSEYGLYNQGSNFLDFFTSMFIHVDWFHIIGNMVFLWAIGNAVNSALGNINYLLAYLALGVFASFGHTMFTSDKVIPAVGASGAIAGVVGLFFALNARDDVKVMYFIWIIPRFGKMVGWIFGFFFFIEQLMYAVLVGGYSSVGYWVHLFGLVGGFALGMLFLQIRLIQPTQWDFYALFRPKPKLALVEEGGDYRVIKDDPYARMREQQSAGSTIVRVQTQPPPPVPPTEQPLTREAALQELNEAIAAQNRLRAKELYSLLLQLDLETPILDNAIAQVASYFYLEGKHVDAVRAYCRLLERFPSSDFTEEAMFRVAFINQHHLRDKGQAVSSYTAYLQRYPQGRFVEQANKEMKMLVPKKS